MSFGKIERHPSSYPGIGSQERIAYHGDLKPFMEAVVANYDFGSYVGHEIKQNGYEDFNLVLETSNGKFFTKCFAAWRSQEECVRYIEMIQAALGRGKVTTPFIYSNSEHSPLTTISIGDSDVWVCTMEYLDGGNVWESQEQLSTNELAAVVQETAKINSCQYQPTPVKDSWAITNASETYQKNKERIEERQRQTIESLLGELSLVRPDDLPQAFVHGDIRSTNVMRHSDGKIYIIDFSVANWYPRIVDLAVLCSDLLFDPKDPEKFPDMYSWALSEYQKAGISLSENELKTLPLFVRLAHAMNVIGASAADSNNYISAEENKYWLNIGKKGLDFTTGEWRPEN